MSEQIVFSPSGWSFARWPDGTFLAMHLHDGMRCYCNYLQEGTDGPAYFFCPYCQLSVLASYVYALFEPMPVKEDSHAAQPTEPTSREDGQSPATSAHV